jgi:hypothetical protein
MEKPGNNLKPVMFNQGQIGFERRSLIEMIEDNYFENYQQLRFSTFRPNVIFFEVLRS